MHEPSGTQPVLLNALGLDGSDIGSFEWNRTHNTDRLSVTNEGLTIEWDPRKRPPKEKLPRSGSRRRPASISIAGRIAGISLSSAWESVRSESASCFFGTSAPTGDSSDISARARLPG